MRATVFDFSINIPDDGKKTPRGTAAPDRCVIKADQDVDDLAKIHQNWFLQPGLMHTMFISVKEFALFPGYGNKP